MLLLFLLLSLSPVAIAENKDVSNGFGNTIDWIPFSQAIGVAKDLNKPIFFLIHKTWCGACKGLKNEFKQSAKIGELVSLSEKFVMVNVEDDQEPEDSKYAPDGGYIPRILFLDTDGNPMKTNNELKYKNNKYFYPLVPQILDGMERALLEFEGVAARDDSKVSDEKLKSEDEKTKEKKSEEKDEL